ncbi:MAG: AMP-binding protein [Planctomycetota bacterium]
MPTIDISTCQTFPELIRCRADRTGGRIALKFVTDEGDVISWTYQELWARASAVARQLAPLRSDTNSSELPRALLLFPPGLEFMAGFLGAQIAGFVPVPTAYPKPNREMPRVDSAAKDCQPVVLIGDQATLAGLAEDKLSPAVHSIPRVSTDGLSASDVVSRAGDDDVNPIQPSVVGDSIAFLQYTSGSTSDPKGVIVRQRHLMSNLESIRRGFKIDMQADDAERPDSGVFWLPFFHDMGLIGGILEPLYVGGTAVLMSPRAFLQRPLRWLQLISDERAIISGAPNFAFQLAIDRIAPDQTASLDLSNWKTAFCGAEPIAPRTLSDFGNRFSSCGFSESAFYPCYGLAEATLLAAGGDGPAEPHVITVKRASLGQGRAIIEPNGRGREFTKLVSCGTAAFQTEMLVVDPDSHRVVEECQVGEIWLRGDGVSDGYWNREEENKAMFQAVLAGQDAPDQPRYCRTGDLGFLHEGQVFITGRRKDVIILRGRNHYPQDIEATVSEVMGSEAGQVAAFANEGPRSEQLVIVAELPRRSDESEHAGLVRSIRQVIIEAHEVDPGEVVLVRQATVPLTSSGKVQRSRCRELFKGDELKVKYHYRRSFAGEQAELPLPRISNHPAPSDGPEIQESIEEWMNQWLVVRAGINPNEIELDRPFADYGLDSMTAVELSGEVEDWSGIELTPMVALNYPTVTRLSGYITGQLVGQTADVNEFADVGEDVHPNGSMGARFQADAELTEELDDDEMESLLSEIENLSDDEIKHALADKRRS